MDYFGGSPCIHTKTAFGRSSCTRNTVRSWLRQTDAVEPKYPKRVSPSVVDEWAAPLISMSSGRRRLVVFIDCDVV
ncbi:hypothetical protein DM992_20640 [Burkholderia sp. JP2-270]|nr:hypothetical protein DM992_20640 [Burkholderia sp. JP2-270]